MADIKEIILDSIDSHPQDLITFVAKKVGVTRPAVFKHIKKLITEKKIKNISKNNRVPVYKKISNGKKIDFKIPITPKLSEDEIWNKNILPLLTDIPKNVLQIFQYGFTEMLNNVVDHSEGTNVMIEVGLNDKEEIYFSMLDNGIGIFEKIKKSFNLQNNQESILHLSKGKLTTDPERHSGEGIFFSSRIADSFCLLSNLIQYIRYGDLDWMIQENDEGVQGTYVSFKISKQSNKNLIDVFKKYAPDDDYGFSKTHALVKLSKNKDDIYISRSQAKRLVLNLEKFLQITLDFKEVETVGQGFVDEVFRVFANAHPAIKIDYINANNNVEFMIKRSLSKDGPN